MLKQITKALNIEALSKRQLMHLLLISFLLGCFNALFFITAFSEFTISRSVIFYPQVISGSGIIGILIFTGYKYFNSKFYSFSSFQILNAGIILITATSGIIQIFFPSLPNGVILLMLWLPFTISLEQTFSKTVMDLPDIRDYQNISRLTESGSIAGSVFFSLVMLLTASMDLKIPFIFTAIAFLLSIGIYLFLLSASTKTPQIKKKDEPVDSLISLITEIPLKKTVLAVAFFSFFSIITYSLIEYTFLSSVEQNFITEKETIQFFGFFLASTMILNFLFKLFVYQNLIKTFGFRKALQFSPFAILILSGAILFLVSSPPFKFPGFFSMAFISIIFCRVFIFLLKQSFELYPLKLLFAAIEVFTKRTIEGYLIFVFNFWSIIFAGILLLLMTSANLSFNFITISAGSTVFWLISATKTSDKYQSIIGNTIEKLKNEFNPGFRSKVQNFRDRMVITSNITGMRHLLNFQKNYDSIDYLMQGSAEKLPVQPIYQKSYSGKFPDSCQVNEPVETFTAENISALAVSTKVKDRIWAAKMIDNSGDAAYQGILKMLLNDPDDEVKRSAIYSAASTYNHDIITDLITYLENEEFSDLTANVLTSIGTDAVIPLVSFFKNSETRTGLQLKIIKILRNIETPEAYQFLLEQLSYPNRWIVMEVLNALVEKGFSSSDSYMINKPLKNAIAAAAWLLAMEVSLQKSKQFSGAGKAVAEEFGLSLEIIFNLLQLKYDPGIISKAKENIVKDASNERRELSIELLDRILEREIKIMLFPLLHNNRKKVKALQLQNIFPVSLKSAPVAIREIINSDLGNVSLWTKACALNVLIESQDVSHSDDVYAHAFNAEPLLAQLAFFGIYKWNNEAASDLLSRLPERTRKEYKIILEKGINFRFHLLFYKISSLKDTFFLKHLKGLDLIPFAEVLNEHYLEKDRSFTIQSSEEEVLPLFMVPFGKIVLTDAHKKVYNLNNQSLYGLNLYAGQLKFTASTDSVIYLVKPDQISSLLLNHEGLLDALQKYLQNNNFY